MRCMDRKYIVSHRAGTKARRSSGDPPLRSKFEMHAGAGQQIDGAEKKATPKGGLSQGGNARKGLWDQAAACSIGEKGSPRLSATAS